MMNEIVRFAAVEAGDVLGMFRQDVLICYALVYSVETGPDRVRLSLVLDAGQDGPEEFDASPEAFVTRVPAAC